MLLFQLFQPRPMDPSTAQQGQQPAAPTIASLGDDLLAKCFSLLEQADL